jgi:hypothetical protein
MIFDRRRLLGSAAALGAGAALPRFAWAQAPIAPPKASVRPVTETLHGVTVADPAGHWFLDAFILWQTGDPGFQLLAR